MFHLHSVMHFLKIALPISALITGSAAHMLMSFPLPRGYKANTSYGNIDYNLSSPMSSNAMCKGKPPGPPTMTVNAGETVNVRFEGSARHGGGLCQFALSYDGDKSFTVIKEYKYGCPDSGYAWPVSIPANAPSCERCTFAWTWVNAIGNREYYMDCADVKIIGNTSGGSLQGSPLKVYNLPGYPTYMPPSGEGGPTQSTVTEPPVGPSAGISKQSVNEDVPSAPTAPSALDVSAQENDQKVQVMPDIQSQNKGQMSISNANHKCEIIDTNDGYSIRIISRQ